MKDLPKPVEPLVVTTVSSRDENDEVAYRGVSLSKLLEEKRSIEEVVWLLWTGKMPGKVQAEFTRMVIVMIAEHSPAVAGEYATILAQSAGLDLPQAVAAGVQMIGPRFGGAAGAAAGEFKVAVTSTETVEQFESRMKAEGKPVFPGIGHRIYSKSRPDKRVAELVKWAKENVKQASELASKQVSNTPHLDFALRLEEFLLKKNEKLILNIDGAIGAILMDLDFPLEGVDGFFVLARTIGLIAHYIDQKQRGTGLIRIPEELVLFKSPK